MRALFDLDDAIVPAPVREHRVRDALIGNVAAVDIKTAVDAEVDKAVRDEEHRDQDDDLSEDNTAKDTTAFGKRVLDAECIGDTQQKNRQHSEDSRGASLEHNLHGVLRLLARRGRG